MMKRACILAAAAVLAAVASAEEKIKIGGLVGPHPDFDKHPELLSPSVRAKIDRARRSLPRYEDTGSNNYTYKAGNDIYTGPFNFTGATAFCDSRIDCLGFTFASNDPQPTSPVNVYFKSVVEFSSATGWATWVKTGAPSWPALNFTVTGLNVGLRAGSHAVQILALQDDPMPPGHNFSFVPPLQNYNRPDRSLPGCTQLGDVTLRIQPLSETNASSWAFFSSAWGEGAVPAQPVTSGLGPTVIAADDITPLLNATPAQDRIVQQYPLTVQVVRQYETYTDAASGNTSLVIRWNLTALADVRIGGLGFSMPADDSTDNLQLPQIATRLSFVDPHIGGPTAYAEWTRIVGNVTMLVVPHEPAAKMEAWRPMFEDCNYETTMSEWTVYTAAWASEWATNRQAPVLTMPADLAATGVWPNPYSPWPEWHGSNTVNLPGMEQRYWLPPSQLELQAGQTATFALRLVMAPAGPRTVPETLVASNMPAITAVPSFVISTTMTNAAMLVTLPAGLTITGAVAEPSGVLSVAAPVQSNAANNVWSIAVTGQTRGRVRVTATMSDGRTAIAHYYVLPDFQTQIANLGVHWSTVAWLPLEFPDQFGRSAAVLPWNRELGIHLLQDSRAYIVGLSDDAGAGNNLGLGVNVNFAPTQATFNALDQYQNWTLYGIKPGIAQGQLKSLQGRPGDNITEDSIRMTMYFYCSNPGKCTSSDFFPYNYTEQDKCGMPVGGPIWCMTYDMTDYSYRGFNVPHQTNVWLGLYRASRYFDKLSTLQPWSFYLERAYKTSFALGSPDVGLMDGTVFREVLLALQLEGLDNATYADWATQLSGNMKQRADGWSTQVFPYGSEFAYDTTGFEEVAIWLNYYNYTAQAQASRECVLGFMRKSATWAYHGGSRSLGDLGNNGHWFVMRGGERILMHYRAGLNQIPLIEAFRANPDDLHLLEVSMGAIAGQLTNIDESGATSMGFHSVPFILEHDPNSGDYGLGYFGLSLESAAYVVNHPVLGWLCYLCNVPSQSSTAITIMPQDAYRMRVYLEPLGLYMVAQSGTFSSVALDLSARTITLSFTAPGTAAARLYSNIYLQLLKEGANRPGNTFTVTDAAGQPVPSVRGLYQIAPNSNEAAPTTATISYT